MLIAALTGVLLVINVSSTPGVDLSDAHLQRLPLPQKNAAMQPRVRAATECIARKVAADPRYRKDDPTADLAELIVASVPSCAGLVREMIAGYDRYFGDGAGEAFFMGPYLDVLPAAVND